jgi:hypothetical protein
VELVADTNVWYDIGAGRRNPLILKSGGNRVIATPTSFLEIASGIEKRTLGERTAAAKAVLAHADDIADDSESHLRRLSGLPASVSFPWIEGFKAIAQSASVSQLKTGVDDLDERVRRTLDVPLAAWWRTHHWKDFADKVTDAIDQHCPGYKAARFQGRYIYLKHDDAKAFARIMRSDEIREFVIRSTFIRAQLENEGVRESTKDEYLQAGPLLTPYANAYIEYVIGCATGQFAPQVNDLGDSECFLYLQNDRKFLSSDVRWAKIARRACPLWIHDPENKVAE